MWGKGLKFAAIASFSVLLGSSIRAEAFLGTNEAAAAVCNKLTDCNPELDWDLCRASILSRKDIDTEVGFLKGSFVTYQEAIKAELDRKVRFFVYEFNSCLENLNALTCSDPSVTEAYQRSQSDPYAGVTLLFSPVCTEMFWYEP